MFPFFSFKLDFASMWKLLGKNKNKARKNEQQLERNQTTTPAAYQMENGKQQCYIRLCYIYNAA